MGNENKKRETDKKYQIKFICRVTLYANDTEEAVRLAWLRENLDKNGTYEYVGVKQLEGEQK